MISVSAKILLHDNSDKKSPIIVDKIPGDQVCVISFGGGGIINQEYANKLARIISNEILSDVGDVSNYALFYDGVTTNSIPFLRANEKLLFERKAKNFLPKDNSSIYISEKNANTVFHQRIRKLLISNGSDVIKTINFVVDGDTQKMTGIIKDKIKQIAISLNFSDNQITEMLRHVSNHVFSYSKYYDMPYLNVLFNQIFLPRISDEHGRRLPLETAMQRMRKMNIFAHCYGGYISLMMEDRMHNKMLDLGYTKSEIRKIQSQLLIVALNPSCPLGISKFQFVSFISGYDDKVMRADNWISELVKQNRELDLKNMNELPHNHLWNLKPGFLEKSKGNVFFAKQRFELIDDGKNGKTIGYNEHNNMHWFSNKFTVDGELLANFAHNILVAGLRNSLSQNSGFKPLPPLEELILDGKNDKKLESEFKKMIQNGKDFLHDAYKYAVTRIRAKMNDDLQPIHNTKEKTER